MNWDLSPSDVKWIKGMNEITGDASKTKTIMDEFSSLICMFKLKYFIKKYDS